MANLNDETTQTDASVPDAGDTTPVVVSTADNGGGVTFFVDDGAGGAPSDFTITIERYSEAEDRWMSLSVQSFTTVSNPVSVTDEGVPSQVRATVTNDSGGPADFRVSGVSY